jgi:hypothetical protein
MAGSFDDVPRRSPMTNINGFQATREWYAKVKAVADERKMTIGATIQYLVNLGLPLYDRIREQEQRTIQEIIKPAENNTSSGEHDQ